MRHLAIFFMFVCAILTSCQPKIVNTGPWVKKIDSEEMSKIVINFSVKMKIDKHLELEDSWTEYDDYITKISLIYSSQRLVTLYDARLILVELVEEFLERVNNNTVIGFELDHSPFTADDLEVKLSFENFYGQYIDELFIGIVWLKNGCSYFYAFDRKDRSMNGIDWDHHRYEPYSKSRELALIKKQADIPFIETRENPTHKVHHGVYQRYFSPNIN